MLLVWLESRVLLASHSPAKLVKDGIEYRESSSPGSICWPNSDIGVRYGRERIALYIWASFQDTMLLLSHSWPQSNPILFIWKATHSEPLIHGHVNPSGHVGYYQIKLL